MRKKLVAIVAALFVGLALPMVANAKEAKLSKEQIRAARDLMAVTGAEDSFRSILAVMGAQITNVVLQQNKGKEKQVREILNPILADAAKRKEEMVAQAAKIYARKFTIAEMKQITRFYKTPVGRKLVKQLPQIMQESMRVGQFSSQKIGADIIRRFKEEAKKKGL